MVVADSLLPLMIAAAKRPLRFENKEGKFSGLCKLKDLLVAVLTLFSVRTSIWVGMKRTLCLRKTGDFGLLSCWPLAFGNFSADVEVRCIELWAPSTKSSDDDAGG
jgi:hypothetical protein